MLHPKTIHFPSGYPISRSPPVFVCASPGPDPYRSLDNVYEELGPRDSDIESEPRINSDDDFAEDELSLNGAAIQPYHITSNVQDGVLVTANTSIPMTTSTLTCGAISQTIPSISSIYNECLNSNGNTINAENKNINNNNGDNSQVNGNPNEMERSSNDRNSLLSSSSSSTSTVPVNDCVAGRNSNSSCSSIPTRIASPDSGLAIRNRSKRMRNGKSPNDLAASNRLNEDGSIDDTSSESNRLMNQQHYFNQHHHYNQSRNNNNNHVELSHSNSNNSSLSIHLNNVNNNNVNRGSSSSSAMLNGNQTNGLNSDVERHNQINKQLSASEHPLIPKFGGNRLSNAPNSYQNQLSHGNHNEQMISTIFPGRLINSNSNINSYNRIQLQNQYYTPNDNLRSASGNGNSRSRTNPRASRQRNTGNSLSYSYQNDNTYSYAEPIFRENLLDTCAPPILGSYRTISTSNRRQYNNSHHQSPYVLPNYQDYNDRIAHSRSRNAIPSTSAAINEIGRIQPIYSHDSSFGSDSGYSHYTHNSRSKSEGSSNSAHSGRSNGNSTLSNMFSWARRKDQQQQLSHRNKTNNKSTPTSTSLRNS